MSEWPLWEVFVRPKRGLSHTHVGSLHAPDARLALHNARDVYTRRSEGVSIWVVPSAEITASSPNEKGQLFGFDRGQEISTQSAEAIVEAAKRFGQSDDITVVAIARDLPVIGANNVN